VERVAAVLDVLPPQMRDPVLFAIPFFVLLLILEWTAARKLERIESADERTRVRSGAFHTRDSWASISMGLVSVATTAAWKFIALLGYAAIYAYLAPWHLSAHKWYTWVIAIVIPRARSSGALSIDSNARNSAPPCADSTFVIAAVSVVFPWSTWPIVPTLQCGLVRSNFSFVMFAPCSLAIQV